MMLATTDASWVVVLRLQTSGPILRTHTLGPKRPHKHLPEGESTQDLRTLVPNTIKGTVFGTGGLNYWGLGPSGSGSKAQPKRDTYQTS